MKPLSGKLLIAVPELGDSNFYRTVVLMIQHSEEGACGVILNRPTNVSVSDVWGEVSDEPCDDPSPVYLGGPVTGPLMAIHQCVSLAEQDIIPGTYMSIQRENISAVVAQNLRQYKLFTSYSGWSPDQLEAEIEAGGWLCLPATEEHIFQSQDELWKDVCEVVGNKIMFPASDRGPVDSSLN